MNIGIVIPAHNEAPFLGSTLDSLLAQSLAAQNIILVNDNSTDTTGSIAEEYARKHANILNKFDVFV